MRSDIERFWNRVEPEPNTGCWLWTGAISNTGYGAFWAYKAPTTAHKYSYQFHVGLIPEGLQIDHLCRVRSCVNPKHLELVTPKENNRRSMSATAIHARKTHCKNGHGFWGRNLYLNPGTDYRKCRICQKRFRREAYERQKCNQ